MPSPGPYFNFTVPEPTGVVATLAPDEPALEGIVSRVLPALVSGNVVVAVASESSPLAAIELAEAAATSDMPGGALNILTGRKERAGADPRRPRRRERDRPDRARTATSPSWSGSRRGT